MYTTVGLGTRVVTIASVLQLLDGTSLQRNCRNADTELCSNFPHGIALRREGVTHGCIFACIQAQ
jgi:hypothetical protein